MNDSRTIISNQPSIHDGLEKIVNRHLSSLFRRPFPDYSIRVFEEANRLVKQHNGPLILDSYCGVGESTANLARQFPKALIIGIDKSSYRLNKHESHIDNSHLNNYHLFRADVDDFWRLALEAGWQLEQHYILYPNPWPKSTQLKRRVHGSPLFPTLLKLGGSIEVRSNWPIYIQEFAEALRIAGYDSQIDYIKPEIPITPFERKYYQSGQDLWRCCCQL